MTLSKDAKTIAHCLLIIIKRETIHKHEQMLNGWQLFAFFVYFFFNGKSIPANVIIITYLLQLPVTQRTDSRSIRAPVRRSSKTEHGPNEIYAFVLFINFVLIQVILYVLSMVVVTCFCAFFLQIAANCQRCCPIRCCFVAPHCLNIIPYDRTFSFTRALTFQHSFPLCVAWLFILL